MFIISCGDKAEIVAKVGNEKITVDEFTEVLNQKYKSKPLNEISVDQKKEVAQDLVNKRLKVLKARELDLDKSPEFKKEVQNSAQQIISQKLFEVEIVDELIPEKDLRDIFNFEKENVRAIVIAVNHNGTRKNSTNLSPAQAEKLGEEIVNKLKSGEDAKELSQRFSDNSMVRRAQGVFDPYKPGTLGYEIDLKIARASKNDIIGPVMTDQSVLIIKVDDIKKSDKEVAFKSKEMQLKRQLYMKYFRQDQGTKRYQQLTKQYKSEMDWEIFQDGIAQFVEEIKNWSAQPNPKDLQFTNEQRSIKLAQIEDIEITSGYFIDKFRGRFAMMYKRYENTEAIEQVLQNHLDFLAWNIKAKEKGIDKRPDVKEKIESFKRSKLAELYDSKQVGQKVEVTEQEIKKYYQTHKEEYIEPTKIQVWEIAVKDLEKANQIYQKVAQNPDEFQKLAKQHTERRGMKRRRGSLGYLSKNAPRGQLVKTAFEAGPNQIVEPFKNGPFYSIIKTGDRKESRQKSLKEVKKNVEHSLRREKQENLRKTKIKQLQNEYSYWINESLIKSLT